MPVMPIQSLWIRAHGSMYWYYRQRAVIEPIINLTIIPFLSNPFADFNMEIWRYADEAGIEKPMEVSSE